MRGRDDQKAQRQSRNSSLITFSVPSSASNVSVSHDMHAICAHVQQFGRPRGDGRCHLQGVSYILHSFI